MSLLSLLCAEIFCRKDYYNFAPMLYSHHYQCNNMTCPWTSVIPLSPLSISSYCISSSINSISTFTNLNMIHSLHSLVLYWTALSFQHHDKLWNTLQVSAPSQNLVINLIMKPCNLGVNVFETRFQRKWRSVTIRNSHSQGNNFPEVAIQYCWFMTDYFYI